MKTWYGFMVLILTVQFSFAQKEKRPADKSVHVFNVQANDSVKVDVNLEFNRQGNPTFYSAHLETDVCSDGLCKPISVTIRWNLLGNFHSYQTDEKNSLTKFDHVELTKMDHQRLHEILSDTASILRDYYVEDMIDTTQKLRSLKVDAVTGATSITFDGATVEGALYTVYTLWHFTNGDIRKELLHYTESLLTDSFIKFMLHSNNRDYTSFTFKKLTAEQIQKFQPDILALVSSKDEYIPHFALAQLTDESLADPLIQHHILNFLSTVTVPVQNALLDRIKLIKLDSKSLQLLLDAIPGMHGVQIIKSFSIINHNKEFVNVSHIKQLEHLSNNRGEEISRGASSVLSKISH